MAHKTGGKAMFGNASAFDTLLEELRQVERGIDEMFGRGAVPASIRSVSRGTFPATNVGATEDEVHVYLFAPGFETKSFDISIQQNLLLVSGSRKLPINEQATYFRQERFDGEFRRVIALPEDVDPQQVQATYRDGVLQITLRRRESAKPRQIQIN
jgi:HSP20 family protein